MSLSSENLEHGYAYDLDEPKPSYIANDTQWRYIQDIGSGSLYPSGQIRFQSVSLFGNSPDLAISLRNAVVAIPMTVTMSTNGIFGISTAGGDAPNAGALPTAAVAATQGYSLALKSALHCINQATVKLNGVQVSRANDFQNLLKQEMWKTFSADEQRILGEKFGHFWDDYQSYNCTPAALDTANDTFNVEYNNRVGGSSVGAATGGVYGLGLPQTVGNSAMVKKMEMRNNSLVNGTMNMTYGGLDSLTQQTYRSHFQGVNLAPETIDGVTYQPGQLCRWNWLVTLPLGAICDLFDHIPIVNSVSSLEISIGTNLDPNNS
jgi:hypothetical protein